MTRAEFQEAVEAFIDRYEFTPTRFGKEAASDPRFVFTLREGRECREATRDRVLAFMRETEKHYRARFAQPLIAPAA